MLADIGPNRISLLYRSVSPWEMAAILSTRAIVGRRGTFSGDHRSECQTWFGSSIEPIIHSGEDYLRYTTSMPELDPIRHARRQLGRITSQAYDQMSEIQRKDWPYPRAERVELQRLAKLNEQVRPLEAKLDVAFFDAISKLAREARASADKLPVTSYVVVVKDMPGGTMYEGRDSMQSNTIEVCFPASDGHALYDHILAVELIKHEGGAYSFVDRVFAPELDALSVRLPTIRQASINAPLNLLARMRPKLQPWIDV